MWPWSWLDIPAFSLWQWSSCIKVTSGSKQFESCMMVASLESSMSWLVGVIPFEKIGMSNLSPPQQPDLNAMLSLGGRPLAKYVACLRLM